MSASPAPPRTGVLLIALGTPDAPTPEAVRRYLKEFLSDPYVVELPRFVWLPILHLFVLRRRPKASAARYEKIWTREGSPLRIYTERQAKLLRGYLGERGQAGVEIEHAMRYGSPSIASGLENLRAKGCGRILVVPLYPQYSRSTTTTATDAAARAIARMAPRPDVQTIPDFHDDPGYIAALAHAVREHWMKRGRPDLLLMSFHGIPQRAVDAGDPYRRQCHETARRLAGALALAPEQYSVAFQSRFGPAQWLKPYTDEVLRALGGRRLETLDVVCPGFVSDCLETLEEIAIEGREVFREAGGGEFRYIACLNDRHEWIAALTARVERALDAWPAGAAG